MPDPAPATDTTKFLRPEHLDVQAGSPDAARHFTYWLRTVQNFVSTLPAGVDKLQVLINYIGFRAYPIVEDSTTYDAAIAALKAAYVKQKNEVYA